MSELVGQEWAILYPNDPEAAYVVQDRESVDRIRARHLNPDLVIVTRRVTAWVDADRALHQRTTGHDTGAGDG